MNIKKVIQMRGWTLAKLACEMTGKDGVKGISQPSVSSIINGNPTIDKLQEIAGIIGVPLSELVADEKNEHSATIICPCCGEPIKVEIIKKSE